MTGWVRYGQLALVLARAGSAAARAEVAARVVVVLANGVRFAGPRAAGVTTVVTRLE